MGDYIRIVFLVKNIFICDRNTLWGQDRGDHNCIGPPSHTYMQPFDCYKDCKEEIELK